MSRRDAATRTMIGRKYVPAIAEGEGAIMVRFGRWGRAVTFAGVAAQLVGLGWDAVLHRLDPELAAREGIFTLTNPGHALFAGGLALAVLGLGLIILGDQPAAAGRSPRRTLLLRGSALGALAALSIGSLVLAASSEGGISGHAHDAAVVHLHEDGTNHTHDAGEAVAQGSAAPPAPPSAAHSHAVAPAAGGDADASRHQHAAEVAISSGELVRLGEQLATARTATEAYVDVRAALRDGYVQVTQDLPGIAAHFLNARHSLDGVFDPARPEILLYAKQDGHWTLVGMSYIMPLTGDQAAPEGFAGPLDVWHYHTSLCFRGQRVISSTLDTAGCATAGGRFVKNTGWQMHLWMYQEGPEGLFAHNNSLLKGSGALLTRADLDAME